MCQKSNVFLENWPDTSILGDFPTRIEHDMSTLIKFSDLSQRTQKRSPPQLHGLAKIHKIFPTGLIINVINSSVCYNVAGDLVED